MIYVFSDANDVSRILLCFLVVLFNMTSVLELSEAQQIFVKEIHPTNTFFIQLVVKVDFQFLISNF